MFNVGPTFFSGGSVPSVAGAPVLLHFDSSSNQQDVPAGGYHVRYHDIINSGTSAATWIIQGINLSVNPYVTSDCVAAAAKFGAQGLRLNEYQTEGSFSCSLVRSTSVTSDMDVAANQPFTLDLWHNKQSHNVYGTATTVYCVSMSNDYPTGVIWALTSGLYSGTPGQQRYHFEGLADHVETASHASDSVYHHIRVTRDSSDTLRIFFDGVLEGTAFTATGALPSTGYFTVGGWGGGGHLLPNNYGSGDYDEVLWLPGVCLSTADFTPPTVAWPPP